MEFTVTINEKDICKAITDVLVNNAVETAERQLFDEGQYGYLRRLYKEDVQGQVRKMLKEHEEEVIHKAILEAAARLARKALPKMMEQASK